MQLLGELEHRLISEELSESTETIEAEVARLEQEVASRTELSSSANAFERSLFKLGWAEERLERARARTDDRPEGCWCRGTGGIGKVVIRLDQDEVRFGRSIYCECDAGQERGRADVQLKIERTRCERARRLTKWLKDLPSSFKAFRSHELSTFPVATDAQRNVLEELRGWIDPPVDVDPDSVSPWLFLHGPVGRGKTGLAVALAKEQIRGGEEVVVIVDVPGLLGRIRRTYSKGADESAGDVLGEMQEADVLILDDFGAERETNWATEMLFSLVNFRYGDHDPECPKLTVITSNYTLAELATHIGDVAGQRIAWRIGERSLVVSLEDCPNLRLPKSGGSRSREPSETTPDDGKVLPMRRVG